jgi:flagellar assembly factor FliW
MEQTVEMSTDGQEHELALPRYRDEDVITFEEGLVGFPGCKRFVVMESEALTPFRIFQCVDQRHVGFLVLDPRVVVKNYNRSIPEEAWSTVGVTDPSERLALVISIIGTAPEESTANLQAPLLINYREMKGRQLILTGARYSVTQPLISRRIRNNARKRSAAGRVN